MPLEATTPESKEVLVTQTKNITHFYITSLHFMLDPNDSTNIRAKVICDKGYLENEQFVRVESVNVMFSGEDLINKIGEITDGTTSVYNNVKQRVWQLLQSAELVPLGTIV